MTTGQMIASGPEIDNLIRKPVSHGYKSPDNCGKPASYGYKAPDGCGERVTYCNKSPDNSGKQVTYDTGINLKEYYFKQLNT
jgi:hypothetical protein